jgi:hypothetical protein
MQADDDYDEGGPYLIHGGAHQLCFPLALLSVLLVLLLVKRTDKYTRYVMSPVRFHR